MSQQQGDVVDCDIHADSEIAEFLMPSISKKLEAMAVVATAWVAHNPVEIAHMEVELDDYRMQVERLRTVAICTFNNYDSVCKEKRRIDAKRKELLGDKYTSLQELVRGEAYVLDDESDSGGESRDAKRHDKEDSIGTQIVYAAPASSSSTTGATTTTTTTDTTTTTTATPPAAQGDPHDDEKDGDSLDSDDLFSTPKRRKGKH